MAGRVRMCTNGTEHTQRKPLQPTSHTKEHASPLTMHEFENGGGGNPSLQAAPPLRRIWSKHRHMTLSKAYGEGLSDSDSCVNLLLDLQQL